MKRIIISLVSIVAAVLLFTAQSTPIESYISKWAPVAVAEMYRSGVPASITLAQGILESRYGLSPLASNGNNHFGIKCHKDWKGKTMAYDDDEKGECFRVYDSADDSFRDHSDFLRYRDRYKFLFEFDTKDYKAWAYGLKKAGYATDPNYPVKLIKYIEDYRLFEYDSMTVNDFASAEDVSEDVGQAEVKDREEAKSEKEKVKEGTVVKSDAKDRKSRKAVKERKARHSGKPAKERKSKSGKSENPGTSETEGETLTIPQSPLSIEEPKKIDKSGLEEFKFSLSRETYSRNGVPFVLSVEGETYSSIAQSNNLFLGEILKYNDLSAEKEILPGTIVYLQAKKSQCEKGLEKYIVGDDSETLWSICQRFGVKMSSIQKMNGFEAGYQPGEGDTILLRGKKVK